MTNLIPAECNASDIDMQQYYTRDMQSNAGDMQLNQFEAGG